MTLAATWRWNFSTNHWIECDLIDLGLNYTVVDWGHPAGGPSMGGFQPFDVFLADGGLHEMPTAIEAEVRERLASRVEGLKVCIRVVPTPDEIHASVAGVSIIRIGTDVLFEGELPPGTHHVRGVTLYPGADKQGRRNSRAFDQLIEVREPGVIVIDDLKPRWK